MIEDRPQGFATPEAAIGALADAAIPWAILWSDAAFLEIVDLLPPHPISRPAELPRRVVELVELWRDELNRDTARIADYLALEAARRERFVAGRLEVFRTRLNVLAPCALQMGRA